MTLPLRSLQLPAEPGRRAEAAALDYLRRVLVDGDEAAPCDPSTPAVLAGMVGRHLQLVCEREGGMPPPAARARVRELISEWAVLSGSLAAMPGEVEDDGGHRGRRDSEGDS